MKHELPRTYDNWRLADCRDKGEDNMPRILSDYHIDQYIIDEVGIEQIPEFFEYLDQTYEERYNFENLNIAEHNIVNQEQVDGGVVYTIEIVWANVEEVIVEDDEELTEIIEKEVETMWEDNKTTEVNYEIDVTEEYWG